MKWLVNPTKPLENTQPGTEPRRKPSVPVQPSNHVDPKPTAPVSGGGGARRFRNGAQNHRRLPGGTGRHPAPGFDPVPGPGREGLRPGSHLRGQSHQQPDRPDGRALRSGFGKRDALSGQYVPRGWRKCRADADDGEYRCGGG
uniref:(northern house mosquito) hypothetical protein n=1 Tax=Culex pipiens TaxID=7175 RepID=A0A8D8A6T6_CULPI